jgi:anti-sigma regulatory factor (Ser/Thr protein kinase)
MEMMRTSAVRISDRTQVAEARRAAMQHARALEWNDVESGEAALVATELAMNLSKHAHEGGAVILNSTNGSNRTWLQVIAVDHGPGMSQVEHCFEDGYSTAGSPGTGLGAVRRIADSLEVYSTPGKGTVLVAELERAARGAPAPGACAIGAVSVPRTGETVCGDAWAVGTTDTAVAVLVVDGLGHGPLAAEAADAAVGTFRSGEVGNPKATMLRLHDALKATRGAAAALAVIDPRAGTLRYCGVGNIVGAIVVNGEKRNLVSHNGTLGHSLATVGEFTYDWDRGATLVMHSDGVSGRWAADQWPGLWQRGPAIGAAVIYRDWRRERDDATVVVARFA